MNRSLFLYTSLLLVFSNVYAQKEYNVWYFGNHSGLNFNTNPPSVLTDSKTYSFESSTSICDKFGNLLFYSNGDSVYNKKHQLMKGGALSKSKSRFSATQGSMALLKPGSDHVYYLILGQSSENTWPKLVDSLCYWVIDMNLENGLGEVIEKEISLLPSNLESFAVTLHSNGIDYWVGSCDYLKGNFNAIRTLNGNFEKSYISQRINDFSSYSPWASKFSPDARIIATNVFKVEDTTAVNHKIYYLNLYRFDNSTGRIYDSVKIDIGYQYHKELEFSPNSRFLYLYCRPSAQKNYGIYQFDLSNWHSDSINNSAKFLDLKLKAQSKAIQLGPDNKLYSFPNGYPFTQFLEINVIPYPDLPYPDCIVNSSIITARPGLGGPYYPNFWFTIPYVDLGNDTFFCEGDTLNIKAKVSKIDSAIWNTGDKGLELKTHLSGRYSLTVFSGGRKRIDEIIITSRPKPVTDLPQTLALCEIPLTIRSSSKGQFVWSTGSTFSSIMVYDTGQYWIRIRDNGCDIKDSVHVKKCKDMSYFIPNAFTPNGNSLNDEFRVIGTNYNTVSMEIFSLWGEKIFSETSQTPSWNGSYLGKDCPQGIYIYKIKISGMINNVITEKEVKGNILLLR